MQIKKPINNLYTLLVGFSDTKQKPNMRVVQKLKGLRQVTRRLKATHSTSLPPMLLAKLGQAISKN